MTGEDAALDCHPLRAGHGQAEESVRALSMLCEHRSNGDEQRVSEIDARVLLELSVRWRTSRTPLGFERLPRSPARHAARGAALPAWGRVYQVGRWRVGPCLRRFPYLIPEGLSVRSHGHRRSGAVVGFVYGFADTIRSRRCMLEVTTGLVPRRTPVQRQLRERRVVCRKSRGRARPVQRTCLCRQGT